MALRELNTFGISASAAAFCEVRSEKELVEALSYPSFEKKKILGGGSNVLITQNINDLVIRIGIKGKKVIFEDENKLHLEVMAGQNWHELVLWAVKNNLGGIENLALIPGQTGTAPIQNIGAYGVELEKVFVSCEAVKRATGKKYRFNKKECGFGYRQSIFKKDAKNEFVILKVVLCLTKKNHELFTGYGGLRTKLEEMGCEKPNIGDVASAVMQIRKNKLPDPKKLGNAGSFFKNPVIEGKFFLKLQEMHPEIPHYPAAGKKVKIPAAWLIEQAGFKGYRKGDAGVHKKQALVLVNYGNARGKAIHQLAQKIKSKVEALFGIELDPEVNIW